MDYQQSRAYIKDAEKYGIVPGLANMRELMKRLGNPQDSLQFVHVAGTNGKGSVITYLYSVLSRAGYRVGRYISPTIYSYRERMEAAGQTITRSEFAGYLTKTADVIAEMTREGLPHPTPFEIETAVAFLFFKEKNCSPVLLEVGMGGSLDATNIIKNTKLAVLASISLDHQSFLGNTLAEIAQNKAGIIKPGCQAVTAAQRPEAKEVIERCCQASGVPLREASPAEAELLTEGVRGQTFRYKNETYELSLAGVYQIENAVLALEALDILSECGYPTTIQERKDGLREAQWGGRFTVIHEKPLLVVDGAHNPAAADQLATSIRHYFKGRRLYYIMGMFRDKDYRSVIAKTSPYAQKIFTIATPGNPRALPAEELAEAVREYHEDVTAMDTIEAAVDEAFRIAGEEDVILAFGSLSFIGELTRIVKEMK
ncbi:MAG: folylpolyglutamate synthase/dihydrofolate synthase family protein [Eubacteriales bacterium]|nr:folylpolyglutamate synthase/dihydrofolate synthase family protein [Eubacteriales bacterium]